MRATFYLSRKRALQLHFRIFAPLKAIKEWVCFEIINISISKPKISIED
jgi:hypothetical protein